MNMKIKCMSINAILFELYENSVENINSMDQRFPTFLVMRTNNSIKKSFRLNNNYKYKYIYIYIIYTYVSY
jgi:hypothetical protein